MYIISKRKDYYDGVAGTTGIDKTIVYDRQIIEIDNDDMPKFFRKINGYYFSSRQRKKNPFYELSNSRIKKEYFKTYPQESHFIIGFCGKIYIGWKLYTINKLNNDYDNVDTTITYDLDYIKKLFEEKTSHGNFQDNINNVLNFDVMDWFRDMNTPCFVYDHDYNRTHIDVKRYHWETNHPKFFINPLLKEYEFYKVFDAVQAFQEIQMFLSGVLGNKEKEIVNVADKYKITQHGFDYKWSFRKEPEKNK